MPTTVRLCVVFLLLALSAPQLLAADADHKALTEALQKFTLPEMPEEWKQKLRDYVPSDLRKRRDAGNAKSTAEWEQIKTREDWEAFRRAKVKLLRESLGESFRKQDWAPPQLASPPEKSGALSGEGYRIEKLLYKGAFGQWVSANLYVPRPLRAKMPGFLISHAHHTPKEQGELQDMGVLWARAGCYVLVPDHLGHGERRQHPFRTKDDYDKPFQTSRQDYYFRYDVNFHLNMVGESLMGALAHDLMTGVSLLLDQKGIDREKIILLGAVAGGGDPCAVTAALDERITCAAPFNFGGPQPETRYPLPEGVDFNYGGSGGWESTRNLAYSYRDGTLPWAIVGSIAPRRLIYAHEFAWDREHDPVWKRLEKIYSFYGQPDHLSFTHGRGTLTSKDPPGSHCTHIGKLHREQMHEALAKWFDIKLLRGQESTDRHDAAELRCWTEELRMKLRPQSLSETLRIEEPMTVYAHPLTGSTDAGIVWESEAMPLAGATARQSILESDGRLIPVLVLEDEAVEATDKPFVMVVTRAGKEKFVRERVAAIGSLLAAGVRIVLPDLYSSGLTGTGLDLGRRSSNTGRSSTLAMFGSRLVDEQARDANIVLAWPWGEHGTPWPRIAVWGDSLVSPNEGEVNLKMPRDDDGALPKGPDPLPCSVVERLLSGHSGRLKIVYLHGAVDLQSALTHQLVLLPHDAAPLPRHYIQYSHNAGNGLKYLSDQYVDATNRLRKAAIAGGSDHTTAGQWLVKQLTAEKPK